MVMVNPQTKNLDFRGFDSNTFLFEQGVFPLNTSWISPSRSEGSKGGFSARGGLEIYLCFPCTVAKRQVAF